MAEKWQKCHQRIAEGLKTTEGEFKGE